MALGKAPHIEVEGYKELQRAIKAQQGKLPASIGVAHKAVGNFVIGKLPAADPHAVGTGSGADVRASAGKRDVIIRVGHAGREAARDQWGKTSVQPFIPGRPHIVGAVEAHEDEIEQKFLDEVTHALAPAFYDAD